MCSCLAYSSPVTGGVSHYCLLMHHIHNGKAPVYVADIMMTATSDIESRSGLRSASNDRYVIPRSRLRLGFAVAGPRAWNSSPARLYQIRSTVTF